MFSSDPESPTRRKFPKNFECSVSNFRRGSFSSVNDSMEFASDTSNVLGLSPHSAAQRKSLKKYNLCSCAALVRYLVKLNNKLLSSLHEIVYQAHRFDKTSSAKENRLLSALIVDRTSLVLFVVFFIVITLLTFLV